MAGEPSVTGYHAHIYFDSSTREAAVELRKTLGERFPVMLGRVWDEPIGPHPEPMYQVSFAPELFGTVVPFLMLNRAGLAVLVHPETGDDVADHGAHAIWLGRMLELDFDFLARHGRTANRG